MGCGSSNLSGSSSSFDEEQTSNAALQQTGRTVVHNAKTGTAKGTSAVKLAPKRTSKVHPAQTTSQVTSVAQHTHRQTSIVPHAKSSTFDGTLIVELAK